MREVAGYDPDQANDSEEEADIEETIAAVEDNCSDFITPETQDSFDEIFEAARKTYSNPELQNDWDQLFEDLRSALNASEDEEEAGSILDNYVKKAKALI
jgi:hypothetical protein